MEVMLRKKLEEIAALFVDSQARAQNTCSFWGDNCGVALFLAYYYLYKQENIVYDSFCSVISKLNAEYQNNILTYNSVYFAKFLSMLGSLSGVGIVDFDICSEIEWKALDDFFFKSMKDHFDQGHFDYLHGGMGFIDYFLLRKDYEAISFIVSSLDKLAVTDPCGLKWLSNNSLTGKQSYDLGLSHGIPSIIVVLSRIYDAGIDRPRCKYLIENAVNYIIHQMREPCDCDSLFGYYVNEDSAKRSSRLGWCYGDLGVALSIRKAAIVLDREDWDILSTDIVLHSSKRLDPLSTKVKDACFCHGASGISFLFRRFHDFMGIPEFMDASNYWMHQAISMLTFRDGYAGYKYWNGSEGFVPSIGLLDGISGVGLSILYSISGIDPQWERLLLIG